jgi:peptidoglycan/LPS O-acetylase OafA/YrhL
MSTEPSFAGPAPAPTSFDAAFQPGKNSFGFLRFLFASLVVYSHSYALGGFANEPLALLSRGQETFGGLAVACFFTLSGFLITRSYTRTSSVFAFLWHRVLRIFPGLWACLIVTAVVFGPIVHLARGGDLTEYFRDTNAGPWSYVRANFFLYLNQFDISGLLRDGVPFPNAFDGSLWTLIYEFKYYIAIGVLGVIGVIPGHKHVVTGLFLFTWGVHLLNEAIPGTAAKIFPYFADPAMSKFGMYFFAGAAFFLNLGSIPFSTRGFVASCLLLYAGLRGGFYFLVSPFALPYVLFWLAFRLPLAAFDRRGDISYGLYIYAFPIQQLLSFFKQNRLGLVPYFALSMSLTMVLAVLSYQLVERPCLGLKDLGWDRARRRPTRRLAAVPGPHVRFPSRQGEPKPAR